MAETDTQTPATTPRIFVEPWSSEYGSPMQIDEGQGENGRASLIDEEGFDFVAPPTSESLAVAFVDGVRRQEAALSQVVEGWPVAGIAGAYAIGGVLCDG